MKAKVTENHDWLRVVATESKTRKLSLTASRYRESCSGHGIDEALMRKAINSFSKFLQNKETGSNYLDKIRVLEGLAVASTTLEQYVEKITALTS